jgi:sodium transport system permease protein
MRTRLVLRVLGKEVLSTLRDRRAIVSNLLIPLLLLPLIMLGLPVIFGGLFAREQAALTPVAVENLAGLPADLAELLRDANVEPRASVDAEAEVRAEQVSLGLRVPPDMAERLAAGERVDLVLFRKQGNLRAEVTASKVTGALDAYRRALVAGRLAAAGLDPALHEPLAVRTVDASSEAERSGGQLSWIIPFFIAIWTLVGGQMTAIDATAGEKERGTLESLLVAPVRRSEVLFGKFLATALFGLSAAAMAIVGYLAGGGLLRALAGSRLGGEAAALVSELGGSLQFSPVSLLLLLVSTLLLSATLAALLLSVTLFARSFKEAQSYVAPLGFLLIVPVLALQLSDLFDPGLSIYLIPVVNVLLLMDQAVTGTAHWPAALATWASLVAVTGALLGAARRNFAGADVIFCVLTEAPVEPAQLPASTRRRLCRGPACPANPCPRLVCSGGVHGGDGREPETESARTWTLAGVGDPGPGFAGVAGRRPRALSGRNLPGRGGRLADLPRSQRPLAPAPLAGGYRVRGGTHGQRLQPDNSSATDRRRLPLPP